jgi:hypothetical protein
MNTKLVNSIVPSERVLPYKEEKGYPRWSPSMSRILKGILISKEWR